MRIVAGDGLAEIDLVVELEDHVGGAGIMDEGEALSEMGEASVEAVVGAEAVGVLLVAGVAEEERVRCSDGGRQGRLRRVLAAPARGICAARTLQQQRKRELEGERTS